MLSAFSDAIGKTCISPTDKDWTSVGDGASVCVSDIQGNYDLPGILPRRL